MGRDGTLQTPDGDRRIICRTELSERYLASKSTRHAPGAVETLSRSWTLLPRRDGPSRPVEKNRAVKCLQSGHNRPVYQNEEMHLDLEYQVSHSECRLFGVFGLRV